MKKPALLLLILLAASVSAEANEPPTGEESQDSQKRGEWLVGGFDTSSRWITAGLALGLGAYLGTADTPDIRDLGDLTQLLPGAFGLSSAFAIRDYDGMKQFGLAAGTTIATTHGLKLILDKTRPDGSEDNSFPSGHTSASVMGAAFVWQRYGARWGAPSSVLAIYTGLSRIRGQKHFADDVISGAALGLISNWLWTDPIDERVRISLFPTDGGAGVQITHDPSGHPAASQDVPDKLPSHFFRWEIGLVNVARNFAAAPNPGGTLTDWRFDEENNPTVTGLVSVGWSLAKRHGVYGMLSPFEVREGFVPVGDIEFAGQTFLAGTDTRSRYVANDYRAGYGYDVVSRDRIRLTLIGSLAVFDTVLLLDNDASRARVSEILVRPVAGAYLRASMTNRWMAFAAFNAWSDSDVRMRDFTVQLGYRIDQSWALSVGYRFAERRIDTDSVFSDIRANHAAIGVWYFW